MRQRELWISLSVVASVALVGLWFALRGSELPERGRSGEDRDDLRHLRALPYLKWTKDNADLSKKGVTLYDVDRASPGYNLYTDYEQAALLVDMDGNLVHTWQAEGYTQCAYAELLPNGDLLAVCVGKPSPKPPGWTEAGLVKLDRNSRKIWEYKEVTHHDVCAWENGWVTITKTPPMKYRGRDVTFDELHFLSTDGKLIERWSTYEHLAELKSCHPPSRLDKEPKKAPGNAMFDYHHLNSVQALPDTPLGRADRRFREGNYLICLRNVNVIAILDRDTKAVTWHWGPGDLDFPHMPQMLPNGNILVFDNGKHRYWSRVLEIDPVRGEISWRYQTEPKKTFFSMFRGSNQRLANGNTLICESSKGRAFEVTPGGDVVWEFWNPIVNKSGKKRRRAIYRFTRVAPEAAAFLERGE